jgi:hypothetical protein
MARRCGWNARIAPKPDIRDTNSDVRYGRKQTFSPAIESKSRDLDTERSPVLNVILPAIRRGLNV